MKMFVSLTRLRGSVTARVMAVWLLVLAISPFTAPFATFDFAELAGDAPIHGDLLSSSKIPKEALATNVASATLTPLLVVVDLPLGVIARPLRTRPDLQPVLRL
jgi:hypothetical protein